MGKTQDLLLLASVGVAGYLAWQSGLITPSSTPSGDRPGLESQSSPGQASPPTSSSGQGSGCPAGRQLMRVPVRSSPLGGPPTNCDVCVPNALANRDDIECFCTDVPDPGEPPCECSSGDRQFTIGGTSNCRFTDRNETSKPGNAENQATDSSAESGVCKDFEDVRRIFNRWTSFEISKSERDRLLASCPSNVKTGIPQSSNQAQESPDKQSTVERARQRFVRGQIPQSEFFDVLFDRKPKTRTKTRVESAKEDFIAGDISEADFFKELRDAGEIQFATASSSSVQDAKSAFESGEIDANQFFQELTSTGFIG